MVGLAAGLIFDLNLSFDGCFLPLFLVGGGVVESIHTILFVKSNRSSNKITHCTDFFFQKYFRGYGHFLLNIDILVISGATFFKRGSRVGGVVHY